MPSQKKKAYYSNVVLQANGTALKQLLRIKQSLWKWSLGVKELDTVQDNQDGKKSSQTNMCLRNNTEDPKEIVHEHPLQS